MRLERDNCRVVVVERRLPVRRVVSRLVARAALPREGSRGRARAGADRAVEVVTMRTAGTTGPHDRVVRCGVRVEALRDELADGSLRSGVARRNRGPRGGAPLAVGGRDHDDEPDDRGDDGAEDDDGPRAHAGLVGVVIFETSTVIGRVKIGAVAVVASGMFGCVRRRRRDSGTRSSAARRACRRST